MPRVVAKNSVQSGYNIAFAPSVVRLSEFVPRESQVLQARGEDQLLEVWYQTGGLMLSFSEAEMIELKSPNTHHGRFKGVSEEMESQRFLL